MRLLLPSVLILALALALAGCAATPVAGGPDAEPAPAVRVADATPTERAAPAEPARRAEPAAAGSGELLQKGTGILLGEPSPPVVRTEAGDLTLNFEDADLREFIKVILTDILRKNYSIDPRIQGSVNLQTSRPLSVDEAKAVFDAILRMNGAALVEGGEIYRVVPIEGAMRGTAIGHPDSRMRDGLQIRAVPLRYIGVAEMAKILEPVLPAGGLVHVDPARNLLLLSGTPRELESAQQTIALFDVNWFKGMSVGFFTLKNVALKTVTAQIGQLFGEQGVAGSVLRVIPIESINAVMVVTPQPEYLDEVGAWIERLDRSGEGGRMLHVYRVKNGRAGDIAKSLAAAFGGKSSGATSAPGQAALAPGQRAAEIGSGGEGGASGTATVTLPGGTEGGVRIVADETNNALLIHAGQHEYEAIEAVLRQIDIEPLQVLVDATIVEVSLTDDLRYGLQWTFRDSLGGGRRGRGTLSSGNSPNLAASFPGFSYSIVNSADTVVGILDMLASESKVRVLSSPSIMVLNNEDASIQVGDQVPVRTSESTSLSTSGDNPIVTSTIQYRDTGVTLKVRPRVNPGGLVIMDVSQEVNDVSATQTSRIDSPTIQQRRIESSVAVQSGDTIVLGGLIREIASEGGSGVPGLRSIPGVGVLFGQRTTGVRRTELVVLITPRVAHSQADARRITDDYRRGLGALRTLGPVAAEESE